MLLSQAKVVCGALLGGDKAQFDSGEPGAPAAGEVGRWMSGRAGRRPQATAAG